MLVPTGNNDCICLCTAKQFLNLFAYRTVFVANGGFSPIFDCELSSERAAANCDYTSRTAQGRTCNSHKTYRANTDNDHGIAVLHISHLNAAEAGSDHVSCHYSCSERNTIRNTGEIHIGKRNAEIFTEHAMIAQRSKATASLSTGVLIPAALNFWSEPVGSNTGNSDDISDFNVSYKSTDFNYTSNSFVA